ncbi:MAG: hypothetical protein QNL04_07215 [SAR324 cluster bacterium]|nr:hypothetical protein [SAR324 cluster bacterium]
MSNMQIFEEAVIALGNLLGKVTKIMKHSDPTAKTKQQELYAKYKANLALLGRSAKGKWDWQAVSIFVKGLPIDPRFSVEIDAKQIVIDKLMKDLGELMVEKVVMPEFTITPAEPKPKKTTFKKSEAAIIKQAIQEVNMRAEENLTPQEKEAKERLRNMVAAINRIGPDILEEKINSHFKEGDA